MSRLGKKPVSIPAGAKAAVKNGVFSIEGPKGRLEYALPSPITVEVREKDIMISRPSDDKAHMALHGMVRTLLKNMAVGVTEGYKKELEIRGVGYKAQAQGSKLTMNLGFSHSVEYAIPDGIAIETPKPTILVVKGIDKVKVGEVAAELRDFHKPEPYKGKGIRYAGEYVRRKAGKTVT